MTMTDIHASVNLRSRFGALSNFLRTDTDAGTIPGAVALVIHRDSCVFHEAFGVLAPDGPKPMARDSVFRIASMTKPMTAVAALMLMERGQLLLADPLSRYLPALSNPRVGIEVAASNGECRLELVPSQRPITILDLMRHTAGFTYGQLGDSLVQRAYREARLITGEQSNADLVAKLAELPLAYQPGSTFEYGLSTDVLGHVVELVAGMSLGEFFAAHITGPLGMHDTALGLAAIAGANATAHAASATSRLAEPLRDGDGAKPWTTSYDPARPGRWQSGGGGLLSTAADYARFCRVLQNGGSLDGVRLLGRKSVELMLNNQLPSSLAYGRGTADLGIAAPLPQQGQGYGLGIGVRTSIGPSPVPGSVGDAYWGGVLGPYFWMDPVERLITVFMLQELNAQRRTRYRSLLRALVYSALE